MAKLKEYAFHPAAEAYPMMPDSELDNLVDDMKENGYDPRFPILLLDGAIIDGRNRYAAAAKAGVSPKFKDIPDDTNPEAFVERANEHRRHLNTQWLQARRKDRVKRIAQAKREGKSNRKIAEEEGVSESQVRQDLERSAQGCADDAARAESSTHNGDIEKKRKLNQNQNGQTDTVSDFSRPKMCDRCERMKRASCDDCRKLIDRWEAKQKLREEIDEAAQEPEEEHEPTIQEQIEEHNSKIESFCRKLSKVMDECPDDPWLNYNGGREGAIQKVKNACQTLRVGKCVAPCPECNGGGCKGCFKTGRITKFALDMRGGK